MLKTETVIIDGKEYIRTWSDIGMLIERDGALYVDAIDPIGSGRIYTETDKEPENIDMEAEEADILFALNRLGVYV